MRVSFTQMKLSAIDVNLLVVLHALLEDPSVARTARRLHVTPPAISNALGRLRALLGDPLFVRAGRGLVPTPAALALAPALRRAVAELESVIDRAPPDPAETTRELVLALADAEQIALLPAVAGAVSRGMPRARLRVISVDTLIAGGGLAAGAADAAVGPAGAAGGLLSAPLYDEEGVLVVRRGHPDAGGPISPERFAALRHVDIHLALGRGGVGHASVEDALGSQGLVRDVAVVVPTFTAAAMVVGATDLVGGLPRRVLDRLAGAVPLVPLDPALPALTFRIVLLWHPRTDADPVGRRFRELVLGAVG